MSNMKVVCLVGGSGSGKDTIKDILPLPHIVSYRTRPRRIYEEDGVHGWFVTDSIYKEMKDRIVAETVYNGFRYWTTEDQFTDVMNNETPIIYVVDWDGVDTLIKSLGRHKVLSIYIDVDIKTLKKRMKKRGDSKESIKQRIEQYERFDKHVISKCDYVVRNDRTPQDAVNEISNIILKEIFN